MPGPIFTKGSFFEAPCTAEARKDIFGVQKLLLNVIYIAKAGIRLKGVRKGCFWGNYFTCWVSILPFWALFGERVFLCGNQWGWVIYGTSWLNRREKLVSVIKLDITLLGNIQIIFFAVLHLWRQWHFKIFEPCCFYWKSRCR